MKSTRDVGFAGFSDSLSARYNAHARQAFIEAGYRFGNAEGGLEPYLQVARVEVDLKQINERGGAAALHGKVDDTGTTTATAGLRFDKGLKASFQQDSWLHLRGGLGYRRAFGDRSQVANLALPTAARPCSRRRTDCRERCRGRAGPVGVADAAAAAGAGLQRPVRQ